MKKESGLGTEEENDTDIKGNSYVFRLYITGASPNSSRAITNLKDFFEKNIKTPYDLQIIDVYQQPQIARAEDIIALPLLVKKFPLPERRLIGDMSDSEKIRKNLNLTL